MNKPASEVHCPACGYYCVGKGGFGCIDKPALVAIEFARDKPPTDTNPGVAGGSYKDRLAMKLPTLTEFLCMYAETHGLDPTNDGDLYDELEQIADDVTEKIDDIAGKLKGKQSHGL
jgi:hypothetical protein